MQLEQLQVFVEVVQKGSFAAVALERQVNASSISRSLQSLEDSLGLKLLRRSTRRLNLTEAGEVYYQQILPVLVQLETAKQRAQDIKQVLKGTLRVTLPIDFSEAKIIPLLPKFRRLHPDLNLELLITDECLDLEQERIDLSVRLGRVTEENWVAKPLRELGFVACATPKFLEQNPMKAPQALQDLPCLNFIRHAGSNLWRFKHLETQQITEVWVKQSILATHTQAVKTLCLADQGVALLPDWLVEQELACGALRSIFSDYQASYQQSESQAWCVYPSREYVPAKTRAFIDFLMAEIQ